MEEEDVEVDTQNVYQSHYRERKVVPPGLVPRGGFLARLHGAIHGLLQGG